MASRNPYISQFPIRERRKLMNCVSIDLVAFEREVQLVAFMVKECAQSIQNDLCRIP